MFASSALLDWRSIQATDTTGLQGFTCTAPAKSVYYPGRGKAHPYPYELEVQSYVRNLRPPGDGESMVLLGLSDAEIRAVACMSVARSDEPGIEMFLVQAVAVTINCRGQGLGDAALQQSIQILEDTNKKYNSDLPIAAKIHEDNAASQALFRRNGFEEDQPIGSSLVQWLRF